MIVLVDLDNTIVDFERGFIERHIKVFPNRPIVQIADRTTFYISGQYPKDAYTRICNEQGFFSSLPPIQGAIDAINEISEKHDVFICSSPSSENDWSIIEKVKWVRRHLGSNWNLKLILAHDKTFIHGNMLIDDRPEITGKNRPTWEHVILEQPYNKHIVNRRKITWSTWKQSLPELDR